ncbi:MAG: hypothetical protein JNJ40_11295 [Bacteroidia bacterium]|nr:hypothetical protein [Bacteroidia bacterium]
MYKFLFLFLFSSSIVFSQYSSVSLTEESAKKIADLSKKGTLYVVINNEKEPYDAALLNAVKSNWKVGSYNLLSGTAFLNSKSKSELSENDLYLYESNGDYSMNESSGNAVLANVLNKTHTGVFYLLAGNEKDVQKKSGGLKYSTKESVKIKFDLSSTLTNTKEKVLDGYFDLMLKYFNNEVVFCQKAIAFRDVKKEDKDGIVYFESGLNDVQTKSILLVKEQVNKTLAADKAANKKTTPFNAVSQFNPPTKNVYTVFPEDIKLALTKADKEVLIFSNEMLLNASNGSVVAAPSVMADAPVKKDHFVLASLGILAVAFVIATLLK